MYDTLKATVQSVQPLSEAEWALMLPMFRYQAVKKGEQILQAGQVCHTIDFIAEGALRIFFNYDGKDISRQFFFERAFVTELGSFLTQQPSRYNIDAVEPCKLLSISYADLNDLYEKSASFLKFGKLMSDQTAIFVINRNIELATTSAKERYLALMHERPKVMSRVPLHMIASYLNITPEALSRLRRDIAKTDFSAQ
ncbi:hypothetical protein AWR27_00745 [Spirosoma montaniterrae]|uniref:Cyclic nucleotide-binding domain-containing protein n=2 Tax=Spirosoma montaniterrae TaxID=1178516 RepID=A0A1P9WRK0_9BACT|nr:hypothetical protein AWR27_00745 [Spirosoma montaniterrae]